MRLNQVFSDSGRTTGLVLGRTTVRDDETCCRPSCANKTISEVENTNPPQF